LANTDAIPGAKAGKRGMGPPNGHGDRARLPAGQARCHSSCGPRVILSIGNARTSPAERVHMRKQRSRLRCEDRRAIPERRLTLACPEVKPAYRQAGATLQRRSPVLLPALSTPSPGSRVDAPPGTLLSAWPRLPTPDHSRTPHPINRYHHGRSNAWTRDRYTLNQICAAFGQRPECTVRQDAGAAWLDPPSRRPVGASSDRLEGLPCGSSD